MAGAFSLFLGLLGLGAAGAVSAGQNAKIKKGRLSVWRGARPSWHLRGPANAGASA